MLGEINSDQLKRSFSIKIVGMKPLPKPIQFSSKANLPPMLPPKPKLYEESKNPVFHSPPKIKAAPIKVCDAKSGVPVKNTRPSGYTPKCIGRSDFHCSVCSERMSSMSISTIEECKHSLHEQCLLPYLQLKIANGDTNLTCPFANCKSVLQQSFLRRVLSSEDMRKYYRFAAYSFAQKKILEKEWIQCPGQDCNEKFKLVSKSTKGSITCTKTGKKFCCLCLEDFHPMYSTCQEFKRTRDPTANQDLARKVIANMNWKQCPSCKVYVEKNQGCDHIACRCGHHFCYKCLGPHPNCRCPRGNPFQAHY